MSSLDITTIVLTYNEEKHIERCLNNVLRFSKKVYVIDSPSTDRTKELCKSFSNVEVIEHKYPGNQAAQFNWALNNADIKTEWIFRLDADEYLSDELIEELEHKLPSLPQDITGCVMKRDVVFMGKRIKHGKIKTIKLLRLWRTGKGKIEERLMDEHAILTEGRFIELKNYFFDDNLNGIEVWVKKHLDYANREVLIYKEANEDDGRTMVKRNRQKTKYYSLPKYHRGFWFFVLRYVFLGGFLDGKAGFVWNFMQCWWYRTLVDIMIEEKSFSNNEAKR